MSLESLSTDFSIELSRFLDSAVENEMTDMSFESFSTAMPNARDTNQISLKMDEINRELEDIKNSFHSSSESPRKSINKPPLNHLDRFESIPANIKAYIRQEIRSFQDKLPDMISNIVRTELAVLIKESSMRLPKSPIKTKPRPPWSNDFSPQKISDSDTISSRLKKQH